MQVPPSSSQLRLYVSNIPRPLFHPITILQHSVKMLGFLADPNTGKNRRDDSVSGDAILAAFIPTFITALITLAILDRKSTRLNSSHSGESRMPSSA